MTESLRDGGPIIDRETLDKLEPEWDRLLAQSDVSSPFLTPGWQRAWLATYGRGGQPVILTARIGGRLAGVWPLFAARRGPFRVLAPIGTGRSDWLDVLTTSPDRQAVLGAFLDYLSSTDHTWDLLEIRDIRADSPTITALESLCAIRALKTRHEPRTAAPYLTLTGNWDGYLASKSGNFRSNLRRRQRRADAHEPPLIIARNDADLLRDDYASIIDELGHIELKSWKAGHGNLKISTVEGRDFYSRFLKHFGSRGELDLWRARLGDKLVAFLINITYHGKCYYYNSSFDLEHADLSPGLLLHAAAVADAFDRGLREYDFLSGEEPFKFLWCSTTRPIHHAAIFNDRATSRVAFAMLVAVRWAFRRSSLLVRLRQRGLAAMRRLLRRPQT